MNEQEFKEKNPDLAHLVGYNMHDLEEMFPDAKGCHSKTCELNDIDHAIFMEYEQGKINDAKQGKIRVAFEVGRIGKEGNYEYPRTKIFSWYNGEKWVKLTQ